MTEDMLRYVYAVVRTGSLPLPDGLRGVGGAPVEAVARDEIAAVVSPVPAVDFDEEPLRAHLEDMRRLELLARGHQEVVAAVSARGCALPLRLATVCRGEPGVQRMLAADRGLLEAAFRALDGRDEWGVKVYADPAAAPVPGDGPAPSVPGTRPGTEPGAEPATAPGGTGDRPSSGRDYLRRRRQQRLSRDESARRAGEWARTAHEALGSAAERCRLHPPQDARLSGMTGENVLNGAYLVPREEAASFAALVAGLADRADGLRVELTGPWAPYSFTGTAGTAGSAGADRSDRAVRPDGADRSQRAGRTDRAEEPG